MKAQDKALDYVVRWRQVKYPRLELVTGRLVVVAPPGYDVEALLERRREWVEHKLREIAELKKQAASLPVLNRGLPELKSMLQTLIEHVSGGMGVDVRKLIVRKMRTKWASMSRRATLTANSLMRHLPEDLIFYIIVHEMSHSKEKRHSRRFWSYVERFYPQFEEAERRLAAYWFALQDEKA
ncbi:MAG: hypothetical protein DRP82_05885 [Planctomycetota bacterium]|nr:MAG: hypothetical protein DRP82_05885 [Planctomycetota bacterium]